VPLECEGRVYFGGNQTEVLAFDSSFLLPLRQTYEIALSSGTGAAADEVL
jgi:hypothetical protein